MTTEQGSHEQASAETMPLRTQIATEKSGWPTMIVVAALIMGGVAGGVGGLASAKYAMNGGTIGQVAVIDTDALVQVKLHAIMKREIGGAEAEQSALTFTKDLQGIIKRLSDRGVVVIAKRNTIGVPEAIDLTETVAKQMGIELEDAVNVTIDRTRGDSVVAAARKVASEQPKEAQQDQAGPKVIQGVEQASSADLNELFKVGQ